MEQFFSVLFALLLHVLFLGAMLLFGYALFRLIFSTDHPHERFYRVLALFLGAMIALGAQVTGVGYNVFAAGALSNVRVVSAGAAVVSSIIPALAGVGLGFIVAYLLRKSDERSIRILGLVGMLSLVSFLVVYGLAVSAKGLFLNEAALPNLSFIVGLGLVVLLSSSRQGGNDASKGARSRAFLGSLRDVASRVRAATSDAAKSTSAAKAEGVGGKSEMSGSRP